MKFFSWPKALRGISLQRDLQEIQSLLKDYLTEQTIGPLKGLAKYLGWGIAGSLFVCSGLGVLLLGFLRTLQALFPVLNGSLSWIPYLADLLVAVLLVILFVKRVFAGLGK